VGRWHLPTAAAAVGQCCHRGSQQQQGVLSRRVTPTGPIQPPHLATWSSSSASRWAQPQGLAAVAAGGKMAAGGGQWSGWSLDTPHRQEKAAACLLQRVPPVVCHQGSSAAQVTQQAANDCVHLGGCAVWSALCTATSACRQGHGNAGPQQGVTGWGHWLGDPPGHCSPARKLPACCW
jgi:hypothetical protein